MPRLLPLVLLVSIGCHSGSSKSTARPESVPGLNGKWNAVSMIISGIEADREDFAGRTMEFAGDRVTLSGGRDSIFGTATLVTNALPTQCDIVYNAGGGEQKSLKGICKVEGDKLTLCYQAGGDVRPTAFYSRKDSGVFLEVYERVK